VFATRAAWDIAEGEKLGLLEGGSIMGGQLIAVAVTWIFSIVATVIILSIINATIGLRVTEQQERIGLDMSQHEEEGYIFA
jgi:Amt family ammonium transporter